MRRRLAFAAMGLGFTLLRPRPRRWAVASIALVVGVALVLVPIR
jgi:drug/metabolite transporter (DMT)-like permease